MARPAPAQCGLTLVELMISLAIAALLAAPLVAMIRGAFSAQSVAGDANAVAQQARFAMQRMEAVARATAPHVLTNPSANSTGNYFDPVQFCRKPSANVLRETTTADNPCTAGRVIADNVVSFDAAQFNAGPGAAQVVQLQLTTTGSTGQSVTLLSRARLGGGTL